MTFEELLDQAIALLQRRGRLTYRALKRQFDLDDDYLARIIHQPEKSTGEGDLVVQMPPRTPVFQADDAP
ncbi:MAG TPA: hypothetical protein VE965_09325 [Gammaproteobacteria bacterium]|jgi:hypothetical protein|nr:hypothetical protein [Gammaproteobacteria bacterium]